METDPTSLSTPTVNAPRTRSALPKNRSGIQLERMKTALDAWRSFTWETEWRDSSIYPTCLMSDQDLDTIALSRTITTIEDFSLLTPNWPFASDYAEDILEVINDLELRMRLDQEIGDEARRVAKEAEQAEARVQREREVLERREARKARTKQAQNAKKRAAQKVKCARWHERREATGKNPPGPKPKTPTPSPPSSPERNRSPFRAQISPSSSRNVTPKPILVAGNISASDKENQPPQQQDSAPKNIRMAPKRALDESSASDSDFISKIKRMKL